MSSNMSLENGLDVLDLLKEADEPLGVREIARRLDLSASVTQRLLNSLAGKGYVEQTGNSRRYQIGYAVLALAQHVMDRDRLIALSRAQLDELAAGGCYNGFLGVRRADVGVYVAAVQSQSAVVVRARPGETMPLHSTALGKALLIDMDDGAVSALFGDRPLARLAERTVTDVEQLIDQLRLARSMGYTTAISENLDGIISVGAPVRDATGAIVAAISLAFPRAVFPRVRVPDVAESVMTAAARISIGLGFKADCPKSLISNGS
jgi:DNA-binding IclR family transcriptional regulator